MYSSSVKRIREAVFEDIYKNKLRGNGSFLDPLSGGGSRPDVTKPYVEYVATLVPLLKNSTVLDLEGDHTAGYFKQILLFKKITAHR
jgi:hypothetical protein